MFTAFLSVTVMPIYRTVPTGYTLETQARKKLHTFEVYPRRHLLCLKPHYTCNNTLLIKVTFC